ncbi:MAG: 4-hydroxythreonine-4-phosphate dehydrogenase PdxA, partial [Deltaproteobacteria bacterium]|nr:4-hydroxythreonine-4-phosphate dehydrogenase PdxA [Deltaproteobacteria bacterium]
MKSTEERPIIGITMGDPVGIGPEIISKALPEAGLYESGSIDVIGLSDLDYSLLKYGHPTKETGRAMVEYVTQGIDWAMKRRIHGLTTYPINKMAMHVAGEDFEGHTELLAAHTKTSDYVMMLAGSRLRVALVTIHVPVAQVPGRLTTESIFKTIRITDEALRSAFGLPKPRLAVAALNPHAGEEGLFGDEEAGVISPAIEKARSADMNVSGPHPPDTLFYKALEGKWDAVVCM